MNSQWKAYFWAAVFSPAFRQCYIRFPFEFQLRKSYRCGAFVWSFEFHFRNGFSCYVPWAVECAYQHAIGNDKFNEFDDIPF